MNQNKQGSNFSKELIYYEDYFLSPALPLAGVSYKCDSVNFNSSTN